MKRTVEDKNSLDRGFWESFCRSMTDVLGEGSCHVLSIRQEGGVELEVEV